MEFDQNAIKLEINSKKDMFGNGQVHLEAGLESDSGVALWEDLQASPFTFGV